MDKLAEGLSNLRMSAPLPLSLPRCLSVTRSGMRYECGESLKWVGAIKEPSLSLKSDETSCIDHLRGSRREQ